MIEQEISREETGKRMLSNDEPRDPRYDALREKIAATEILGVSTLMIKERQTEL
jgi:hypothetical protein